MPFALLALAWLAQSPASLARDIFRELIEIDTTARFGSTRAAAAMAARLKAAGFTDLHIAGPSPTKMKLVARLKGAGPARPLLFIAHLDVVEARKEDWSIGLDPFRSTERSRQSGQTALDMKAVSGLKPDEAASQRLAQGSTMLNSLMRTTCVATTVEAGHARNALPQTARPTSTAACCRGCRKKRCWGH